MDKDKIEKYKFAGVGLNTKDKRKSEKRFNNYREIYHITKLSDLQLLEEKVYREFLQEQTKEKIQSLTKSDTVKDAQIIPRNLREALDENLDQILKIDEKLGLFEENKKTNSWLDFWEKFKYKLQLHAETHRAECTFKCPHCREYTLLLMKIDDFNTFKFNWLKGTFVYNKELLQEIEKGTLTKQRVAEIMGVTLDYIEGLYENVYLKEKRKSQ